MTVVATLPKFTNDWLVHELDVALYRREAVIVSGAGVCTTGMVLGKIAVGAATAAAAAANTGTATIAMHATPTAAGVKSGVYTATVIEPAVDGGTFQVEDPDGIVIGTGVVGTLFANVVRFTVTDGATDLVAGDQFTVTIAEGTGKHVPIDFAGIDGRQNAAGVLLNGVDATSADKRTAILTGEAQIVENQLTWPADATSNQKSAALAQLAKLNIVSQQRF